MTQAAEIADFLGGIKELRLQVENDFDLLHLTEQGLPSRSFRLAVMRSGLSQQEVIASLALSRSTMLRRLKGRRLGAEESEKTIRFARIFTDLLSLFDGDQDKAREWLRRSNRGLAGRRPIELLGSELGARQVEQSIGQLREGVFG